MINELQTKVNTGFVKNFSEIFFAGIDVLKTDINDVLLQKENILADMEMAIFKVFNGFARKFMVNVLENLDDKLMLERDRTIYRHKGRESTVLKTTFGAVEYRKAKYIIQGSERLNASKKTAYLLDNYLNKTNIGNISEPLAEIIAKSACECPYREVARVVSEMTDQVISHESAWLITQEVGKRVQTREENLAIEAENNDGKGKIDTEILFQEKDGIWIKMQGESRKNGDSKEMKVAIAYDGVIKSGKRKSLSNKVAFAKFTNIKDFERLNEGIIASKFSVDAIKMRILNGDGASWIKSRVDEDVYYQLDPFHRNQAITRNVQNAEIRNQIFKLLYAGEIDKMLDYIEAVSNSLSDKNDIEGLQKLHKYFLENKKGLIPAYKKRKKQNFGKLNADLEFGHGGCMESNVFTLIGNRMKNRRACWSVDGANNLASLLCLKHTKTINEILPEVREVVLSEKPKKSVKKAFSASDIKESVGKGYNGFKQASIPSAYWKKALLNIGFGFKI